jgi:glucokinase
MTATAHDATDLVLGVDLGGTKTLIGLVDSSYRIHHREKLPTSSIISGDLSPLIQALLSAIDWAHKDSLRVSTIGLGIAGVPDQEGVDVLNAPNLGQIPGSEIGREIASVLGVPVIMENDVNLGALGEQRCGIATGVSDLVYISVGTGLGVGSRGGAGTAGQVGLTALRCFPQGASHGNIGTS